MKKKLGLVVLTGLVSSFAAIADDLPPIYPFVPMPSEDIVSKTKYLSEDSSAMININDIEKSGLSKGRTRNQPWSGPYWPLKQGMIANPYQERGLFQYVQFLPTIDDIKPYEKRRNYVLTTFAQLTEEELAKLAPSEKYDLLLGNELDLSNRIWDFINRWKNDMKWDYMTSIDLPEDQVYEIEKKNYIVANWEGICHGWAPASGVVPKPEKSVYVNLPDGRRMPFYPEDIKGLISLTWANSLVQDHVLSEGFRCKRRYPKQDKYGRYYDDIAEEGSILPRCGDIHPAVYYLALANITGKQGRSFVVDKDAVIAVSNQPVVGYNNRYYHPDNGAYMPLKSAMINYESYRRNDPFEKNRHPKIKYIVGVETVLTYADWTLIKKPKDKDYLTDATHDLTSLYDLELDAQGNVIGGQWRGMKDLSKIGNSDSTVMGSSQAKTLNQTRPDFLWVVPKNYKDHFKQISGLEKWDIRSGRPAPESWKSAAIGAHSFVYSMSKEYGNNDKCKVKNTETGEVKEVSCEFKYPRPQPLLQVVDQLIEYSKK